MSHVKKIIHTFLHNPMPPAVQSQFRLWCLGKEDAKQKEDALRWEWEHLDPASVLPADEATYRAKFNRLRAEIAPEKPARRGIVVRLASWRVAAAVAVAALVLAAEFVAVKHFSTDDTVCLVTAENSKGRFALPDGSVVWLNSDSQLSYSRKFTRSGKRRVQLTGEAFFDVHRDTLHPFEVEMDELRVRVLGTRFNATNIAMFGTKEVTLQSGSVEISAPQFEQSYRLVPDQNFAYDTQSGEVTIAEVTASNYYSWLKHSIVFENAALHDILVNIEHRYNIRFHIDGEVDTSMRLSFTLYPEALEETLQVITVLGHIHCCQIDEHNILIHK